MIQHTTPALLCRLVWMNPEDIARRANKCLCRVPCMHLVQTTEGVVVRALEDQCQRDRLNLHDALPPADQPSRCCWGLGVSRTGEINAQIERQQAPLRVSACHRCICAGRRCCGMCKTGWTKACRCDMYRIPVVHAGQCIPVSNTVEGIASMFAVAI